MSVVRWLAGDRRLCEEVERRLPSTRPDTGLHILRDNPRRRLWRLDSETSGKLLIKHFRVASGRHPRRERWKARLGRSPAAREWRHLVRLHRRGVAVPEPLAAGILPGGDRLLVLRFVEGRSLAESLASPPAERRALLAALGGSVVALHAAGLSHGDLHPGNVLVSDAGPVLLDLQHARARPNRAARLRDLGALDYSLWKILSRPDRLRLRAAAAGLTLPFDDAARRTLRRVGRAAEARAREHARSRTRRSLRPGRRFARVRRAGARGLRLRELEEGALAEALAAHEEALALADERVLKRHARTRVSAVRAGGRRVVVKEVATGGTARALADLLRGSAARRAWRGGHGLQARSVGAATPLAYLEQRRWGLPVRSSLVLEDLLPAQPADRLAGAGEDAGEVLEALAGVAIALHRCGVEHGDLKASHVWLQRSGKVLGARLLDLEDVRFRRRLPDGRRIRALCQLNASLPDVVGAEARRRAFLRYARALPFAAGRTEALRRVVEGSLARRHRWTGAGCTLAGPPASG